jgi:hypothetical protein
VPLVHAIPVAATVPGTPRPSASVAYNGTSDRSVQVQPLCPTWPTADPALVLTVRIQQSFDGEVTWEEFAQFNISPPSMARTGGGLPSMLCQVSDNLGPRRARVVLSVTGPLTCGVDITV